MNRVSKINEQINFFGMDYINLIVKDINQNFYHACYVKSTGKFTCLRTKQVIEYPVGWDYLPRMSEETEEEEVRILYPD